jgi:hypothetical protein
MLQFTNLHFNFRAVSSVGSEHHVDNVRVAGSSPALPTSIYEIYYGSMPVEAVNFKQAIFIFTCSCGYFSVC